jgi:hypothetical protein
MPFDGFAIGGLAVGEGTDEREECTAIVTELLPPDRPRYLMGVGTTRDLLEAVHRGVTCSSAFYRLRSQSKAWRSPVSAGGICGAPPTAKWMDPSILPAVATPARFIRSGVFTEADFLKMMRHNCWAYFVRS